jgi:hypothetical protein
VIANAENRGFAAGNNVSIKVKNIKGDVYLAGNNTSLAGAITGSVKADS